ncbi:MAG: AMP-binding protein [Pseudomonadota bacterium]
MDGYIERLAFHPRRTAHVDTFVRDGLPPFEQWPDLLLPGADLRYPERLNAGEALLEDGAGPPKANRAALIEEGRVWSYGDVKRLADAMALALIDAGLEPGARVLLRTANTPRAVAAWLAVLRAGCVAVWTMPLLRSKELAPILRKAEVNFAICGAELRDELEMARANVGSGLTIAALETFGDAFEGASFDPIQTYQDDPAILAFTSGTTGEPKACVHFHRDILAMADTFSKRIIAPTENDVFIGSAPMAFTFGLGANLVFPLRAGATVVLDGALSPIRLLERARKRQATMMFTSPTAYKAMLASPDFKPPPSLRLCVSAGETLPESTFRQWRDRTGLTLIDGIGATEMIHIFISARPDEVRAGATGRPVPGYEAKIVNDQFEEVAAETPGRLAVRGPVGCRYFRDDRQQEYVKDGWNLTGDIYRKDADGYFWYVSRADDMIVSSGYNIAAPEVEDAVLSHPAVAECAVVGAPDAERGSVVMAVIVKRSSVLDQDETALVEDIQMFVKQKIAPYKYPRRIEFRDALPKTHTGKVQRKILRASIQTA